MRRQRFAAHADAVFLAHRPVSGGQKFQLGGRLPAPTSGQCGLKADVQRVLAHQGDGRHRLGEIDDGRIRAFAVFHLGARRIRQGRLDQHLRLLLRQDGTRPPVDLRPGHATNAQGDEHNHHKTQPLLQPGPGPGQRIAHDPQPAGRLPRTEQAAQQRRQQLKDKSQKPEQGLTGSGQQPVNRLQHASSLDFLVLSLCCSAPHPLAQILCDLRQRLKDFSLQLFVSPDKTTLQVKPTHQSASRNCKLDQRAFSHSGLTEGALSSNSCCIKGSSAVASGLVSSR